MKTRPIHAVISLWFVLIASAMAAEVTVTSRVLDDTIREFIPVGEMTSLSNQNGFIVSSLRLGRSGARDGGSLCELQEDGRALTIEHNHGTIDVSGNGAYSHWTNKVLYFSSSDNKDPRTNGRRYELVSRVRVKRHTAISRLTLPDTKYRVSAGEKFKNRSLTIRNLDSRIAVVPHLRIEGWPDLTSKKGIVDSIISAGMTDEQKAVAIWKFVKDWRYHHETGELADEMADPVRLINVYGYGVCGNSATIFAVLCREAGIGIAEGFRARTYELGNHMVGEVYYDKGWHMFDADHEAYYFFNGRVASVQEIVDHPEIIKMSESDPYGNSREALEFLKASYTSKADNQPQDHDFPRDSRLNPVLAPGDEVVFDLTAQDRIRQLKTSNNWWPPVFGNGRLVRELDFSDAETSKEFKVDWAYVILGGEVSLSIKDPNAQVVLEISDVYGRSIKLPTKKDGSKLVAVLDEKWISGHTRPIYDYTLRFNVKDGSLKSAISGKGLLTTYFQFAPRALPQLQPGGSKFQVRLSGATSAALPAEWKGVQITHEWDEPLEALPVVKP